LQKTALKQKFNILNIRNSKQPTKQEKSPWQKATHTQPTLTAHTLTLALATPRPMPLAAALNLRARAITTAHITLLRVPLLPVDLA